MRLWPQPAPCYAGGVAFTHRLLALLAPGSIEAEVGALQQTVFSDLGHVSTVALPPLVPVRFLPLEAASRLPPAPGQKVAAGFVVRVKGLAWTNGQLYLGLDTGGAWSALREDRRWFDGPELFPCFEGFYLGCPTPPGGGEAALRFPFADRRFSSLDLAVVSIAAGEAGGEWWDQVIWQIDDRRPLRGKRARAGPPPGGAER
jgi:hypothetical protein